MGVRLEPSDEYMHELGPESNFNESMYINCFDPAQQVGGWFRIGNRANEGYAEMTICLYLPPENGAARRSVGFMYKRPTIDNNDAFDAGGMKWTMVTPFEELRVEYTGKVVLLDEPEQMADPKAAFTNNPYAECEVNITFTGQGRPSMFGGEPDTPHEAPGEEFAKGHYEQLVQAHGTIRVGDREWEIDGHGLRDHSWGPRFWQAVYWYRWLPMNFSDDFAMMVSITCKAGEKPRAGGMVLRNHEYVMIKDARIETVYDEHQCQESFKVWAKTDEREYEVTGKVMSLIPLRNRRRTPDGEDLMTRITEGMTEFECDGQKGYGLSEYLDQIVDGMPVGLKAGY